MVYNWTVKRKAALEYLVQTQGNVRGAAELAKSGAVKVSYGYLRLLVEEPEHRPFRDEYERRTGEMLHDLGITSEYVLAGIKQKAEDCKHDPTQLKALEDLGKWKGIFKEKPLVQVGEGRPIVLSNLSDEDIEELIKKTAS